MRPQNDRKDIGTALSACPLAIYLYDNFLTNTPFTHQSPQRARLNCFLPCLTARDLNCKATVTATPWPRHRASSPTRRRHSRLPTRLCHSSQPMRLCNSSPCLQHPRRLLLQSERGKGGGKVDGEGRLLPGGTGTGTTGVCSACAVVINNTMQYRGLQGRCRLSVVRGYF